MTKARDLSNLISTGVPNSLITLDANEIPNIDAGKITSGSIATARLGNIDLTNLSASNLTSGTIPDARVSASAVSQHATSFDDNKIVNDISTLAIRQASNENKGAYNTNSMFVDVFQDGTGIASNTNAPRNASEYISTVVQSGIAIPSNAKFLLQSETSNGSTTFADTSGTSIPIPNVYNYTHSTAQAKFGSSSIRAVNNGNIGGDHSAVSTHFNIGSNAFSIEAWVRFDSNALNTNRYILNKGGYGTDTTDYDGWGLLLQSSNKFMFYANHGGTVVNIKSNTYSWSANTWYHIRVSKVDGAFYYHVNGVSIGLSENSNPSTSINLGTRDFKVGASSDNSSKWNGYIEDLLFTNGSALSSSTASFTPNTSAYGLVDNTSATGNFISNAITAPSSTNKMGAIITYQDQAGTNTLNTDIVLQLSADNGSNFTTATLTALPDFATGIKMAKVNDLSVTAGTQLKYKISFANQASGSKEARIRGVSLQY